MASVRIQYRTGYALIYPARTTKERADVGEPTPSIGRIVVYNHPGSADGKFGAKKSPAIIQAVNEDGTVEMLVFSVYGGLFFNHNVVQGDGGGQWNWPPRV